MTEYTHIALQLVFFLLRKYGDLHDLIHAQRDRISRCPHSGRAVVQDHRN